MKNVYLKYLLSLSMIVCIVACQKIIQVNLNDATPQLVIDADMSDVYGLQVTLSKSVGFYDENQFPAVNNARITIENLSTHKIDSVPLQSDGLYYLKRKPKVGISYLLTVVVDSMTYTATSTMPEIIHLDTVQFFKRNSFGDNIISAQVNFQDKAGTNNYYLFKQFILKNNNLSFFSFSDRLSDGRYVQYNLRNDSAYIVPGDSIVVNMQCIDKNVYTYFSVLENNNPENSSFTNTSPSNPPNNISNGALGIFNVHSDQIKKMKVPINEPTE